MSTSSLDSMTDGNKPLSAQLTIHYRTLEPSNSIYSNYKNDNINNINNTDVPNDSIEVIETVLNIQPDDTIINPLDGNYSDNRSSRSSSVSNSSSEYCSTCSENENVTIENDIFNKQANFDKLYQCIPNSLYNNQKFIVRRFSEPQIHLNYYNNEKKNSQMRKIATFTAPNKSCGFDDTNISSPCSKHHHRRNSVAIKFNKALYKKI